MSVANSDIKINAFDMPLNLDNFINGQWIPSSEQERIEVIDPTNTDNTIGSVPIADARMLSTVAEDAQTAFNLWRKRTALERSHIMMDIAGAIDAHAETLGRVVAHEVGRPYHQAEGEVHAAAKHFRHYAHEAIRLRGGLCQSNHTDKTVMLVDKPVGVVLVISPWNNPLFLLTRLLAPALAVGCTVIAKPSSETPLSTLLMAQIAHEAGLPEGCFNVVTGPGRRICNTLIGNPIIRKASLTGGRTAGQQLLIEAGKYLKSVSLELGGHCPCIVAEDARLDTAASALMFQALRQAGHVCNRVNRVYIQKRVYSEFVDMLKERFESVRVGLLDDTECLYSALINQSQLDICIDQTRDALEKGARLITGGRQITDSPFDKGYFFEPTLLADCTPDMKIMTEETFGPVLGITSYDTYDEAVALANDTPYGLSSYLFSQDIARCHRAADDLEAGVIWINDINITYPHCPYGGLKESGTGRTQGVEVMHELLEQKTIYLDYADYYRGEYVAAH